MIDYDLELRRHNEALRLVYGIRHSDHVLDIGCGSGQTTREAAQLAREGVVVGIDRSEAMIERARALTRAAGIANVEYECGDVERRSFGRERFDVAISRFGTMFFVDAVAAFTRVYRALRPGGRLVMMVWQTRDRNEWAESIPRALAGDTGPQGDVEESEQPFSLGEPGVVERILHAAGFEDLTFNDVHAPVCYGAHTDAALEFVRPASEPGCPCSVPVVGVPRPVPALCGVLCCSTPSNALQSHEASAAPAGCPTKTASSRRRASALRRTRTSCGVPTC